VTLSSLRPGQTGTVHRVGNENPDLLRYLQGIGVVPQAHLVVRDFSTFDENLSVEIDGRTVVLGPRISELVYVEVDPA
jgi:Fe2+ transport system protein FeoA